MNWTGGALPRSRNSNARATLTATQRKHFAKVRGKLLNGPRSPPDLDFSIFNHATRTEEPSFKKSHSTSAHATGDSSQRRLEDYKQIAPVAYRLSSIRPRQNSHDSASPGGRQREGPPSFDLLRQHPSVSSASAKVVYQGSTGYQYGRSNIPGEPVKLATAAEDSFEVRRQELLQREDWVGLANTKPAKIQFTNLHDRQLIGKRRRLEGPGHGLHPQQPLKRRVIYNHAQESSDFGDISIKIGNQACEGRRHEMTPQRQARSSSGTFDDMLFGDDDIRTGSAQSLGRGRSRTDPYQDELALPPKSLVEGTETSGSLLTSWNGFSPQSNSTHRVPLEDDLRANSEAGSIGPIAAQEASSTGHTLLRDLKPEAAKTPKSPKENPWAGIPGLPLVFEDRPQTPIEISSDSSGESHWGSPSEYTDRPGQVHPVVQQQLDLTIQECKYDGGKLPVTHSPPLVFHKNDQSVGPESRHSGFILGPQQNVTTIIQAPLAMSSEKQGTGLPEVLPAACGTVEYKQPTSTQENQVRLPSLAKKATGDSLSLVDDEEMIWRNFVFGNDGENVDEESEKPLRRPIDSPTNNSSLLTELSERSGQSSLSVQASSVPTSRPGPQLGSASLEADSIQQEASSSIAATTSDSTFSSSVAEGSLPTIGARNQTVPHSSLIAHASVSSSPLRSGHLATSPSPDELAVTPRQPTFFFKRPSRYVGSQDDVPASIHLGQGSKGKRGRQSKATAGQREKWRTDTDAQGAEDNSADEIVDI